MQADRWPTGSTEHKKIIDGYLRESKKKPCEDFRASIQLWSRSGDRNLLYCRRGNACHYSHKLPGTEGPYIFPKGRIIAMVADRMDRGRTAAVAAQPSYPDRLDGETKEAYLTRLQKIEMAHIMRQDARERQRLEEHRERPLSLEFPEWMMFHSLKIPNQKPLKERGYGVLRGVGVGGRWEYMRYSHSIKVGFVFGFYFYGNSIVISPFFISHQVRVLDVCIFCKLSQPIFLLLWQQYSSFNEWCWVDWACCWIYTWHSQTPSTSE